MKKINFTQLLILIFFSSLAYSQEINGEVVYSQELTDQLIDSSTIAKKDKSVAKWLININQSMEKYAKSFEFVLSFTQNESLYRMIEILQINKDEMGYQTAIIFSNGDDIIYLNSVTNEKLKQKIAYGKTFIIKSDFNSINWELHNESKLIDDYKCFKATTTKTVKNSKGIFEEPVTAWYAQDISVKFGPKGYGNLPGLILELQEGKFKYKLSKIRFNPKKDIVIKKPSKGKLIVEKDFEELGG